MKGKKKNVLSTLIETERSAKGGVIGDTVQVGIRPGNFMEAQAGSPTLTATAQVIEQLGGVSYVYALATDGETKITTQ